jgi:hypothetical protein
VAAQVCARPLPADEQSIVGRLPGAEWLYVAVTHSGVTLAAHLSRLIAADLAPAAPDAQLTPGAQLTAGAPDAQLTAGAPSADLAAYRPDRFIESAAHVTGPATGR